MALLTTPTDYVHTFELSGYHNLTELERAIIIEINTFFPDFDFDSVVDTLADLALDSRLFSEDDCLDVRLNVSDDGYNVLFGDSQYDTDHSGFWGYATLSENATITECIEIAIELVESVLCDFGMS